MKESECFAMCPGVITKGEVLHKFYVSKFSPDLLQKNASVVRDKDEMIRYVRGLHEAMASNRSSSAVGFKIMYHQLPKDGGRRALLEYASEDDVVIIHLYRLNVLERYISLEAIRQTNMSYHSKGAPTHFSFGETAKVSIDVASATRFVESQVKKVSGVQKFLDEQCAELGVTCKSFALEHLFENDASFAGLRNDLGLANCRLNVTASALLMKKLEREWRPCSERVSNWRDVLRNEFFQNSAVFLKMCESAHNTTRKRSGPSDPVSLLNIDNAVSTTIARMKHKLRYDYGSGIEEQPAGFLSLPSDNKKRLMRRPRRRRSPQISLLKSSSVRPRDTSPWIDS